MPAVSTCLCPPPGWLASPSRSAGFDYREISARAILTLRPMSSCCAPSLEVFGDTRVAKRASTLSWASYFYTKASPPSLRHFFLQSNWFRKQTQSIDSTNTLIRNVNYSSYYLFRLFWQHRRNVTTPQQRMVVIMKNAVRIFSCRNVNFFFGSCIRKKVLLSTVSDARVASVLATDNSNEVVVVVVVVVLRSMSSKWIDQIWRLCLGSRLLLSPNFPANSISISILLFAVYLFISSFYHSSTYSLWRLVEKQRPTPVEHWLLPKFYGSVWLFHHESEKMLHSRWRCLWKFPRAAPVSSYNPWPLYAGQLYKNNTSPELKSQFRAQKYRFWINCSLHKIATELSEAFVSWF